MEKTEVEKGQQIGSINLDMTLNSVHNSTQPHTQPAGDLVGFI